MAGGKLAGPILSGDLAVTTREELISQTRPHLWTNCQSVGNQLFRNYAAFLSCVFAGSDTGQTAAVRRRVGDARLSVEKISTQAAR